ncbi:hypothetical protein SELMODRAFT_423008 [Selaginella moellendorffii]|uniref:AP-5 complex subunit zeta-1 C-terminal TPR domain-containing protein n=1 Tax=Selaginella moellendorffii TaxID=88036 RepID=D8SK99_SELML|nr:hypothetical protein SELMODRAFT_423008 [Selaginella moellendorffii]
MTIGFKKMMAKFMSFAVVNFAAVLGSSVSANFGQSLEQCTGSLHGNMGNILNNPALEALRALTYTGTFIGGGNNSSKEGSGRSLYYEADDLFSDLLKDENEGLALTRSDYIAFKVTKVHLAGTSLVVSWNEGYIGSSNGVHALKFIPQLLQVYFDVALQDMSDSLLCTLLPMVFFRINAMFPDKAFSIEVQQTCSQFVHTFFKKSPQFIALLKKPITSQPQTSDSKLIQHEKPKSLLHDYKAMELSTKFDLFLTCPRRFGPRSITTWLYFPPKDQLQGNKFKKNKEKNHKDLAHPAMHKLKQKFGNVFKKICPLG